MKRLISVILAVVTAFMAFSFDISAADYSVKVKKTYKNGYTYVTLTPSAGTVYYTTDGTKPDKSDTKYTKKIKITEPTKLRMTIYKNGKAVKSLSAKINVRVKAPSVTVYRAGEAQCKFYLSGEDGTEIYYTLDGSRPDKKTSEDVGGKSGFVTVDAGATLRAVAVKDGWLDSMVLKKEAPPKLEDIAPEEYEKEVVRLVNIERKKVGACELTVTDELSKAADIRAEELLISFSHDRPDGRKCFTVFDECGVIYTPAGCNGAGENISGGRATPEEVVQAWMNSPGHKENMLNPNFRKIGVGFSAGGKYGHNWVQLFTN